MRRVVRYVSVGLLIAGYAYVSIAPSNYVIDVPGPAFNVLGKLDGKDILSVSGTKTYPVSGTLNALTVSQIGNPERRVSLLAAWWASLDPSKQLVDIDVAFPPNVTTDEVDEADKAMMTQSQEVAKLAALNYLGVKYESNIQVSGISKSSAAKGLLKTGDLIVSIAGKPMADLDEVTAAVQSSLGKPLEVGIIRGGVSSLVAVTPKQVDGKYRLGILVGYKFDYPFKIDVFLGDVGGPSAGTMFAIGIVDKLTPGALLKGQNVAGTGTIDRDGNVGPIGGIVQKMYGAKNAGAKVFLAPSENCSETIGKVPSGLSVYRIKKLKDAVALLTAMNQGASLAKFPTCSK